MTGMTNMILAENKLLKEKCEAYEKAIKDIMDEIDEQYYIVKRESIEHSEGLEMASEIIIKHTKMCGGDNNDG